MVLRTSAKNQADLNIWMVSKTVIHMLVIVCTTVVTYFQLFLNFDLLGLSSIGGANIYIWVHLYMQSTYISLKIYFLV